MKINDEVLNTWIKILKKIKNSKIVLKSSLYVCEDVIKKKFEKEGITDSLEILKKTRRDDFLSHLSLYDKVDLCLDTFPFNGVTTTFEALWMGVPVVTLKGNRFVSRCGYSINKNANLNNFTAKTKQEYVSIAAQFRDDKKIDRLVTLRRKLRSQVLQSPLFDINSFTKNFVKNLYKIYKK